MKTFDWITYPYRYYNEETVGKFGEWLAGREWLDVKEAEGSKQMAGIYQDAVTGAMEKIFPLITVRKKSLDCPWINARIRRLIAQGRGCTRGKEGLRSGEG